MTRHRRTSNTFRCGHEGCLETVRYRRTNRQDDKRQAEHYGEGKWLCVRHNGHSVTLTPDAPRVEIEKTLTCQKIGGSSEMWRVPWGRPRWWPTLHGPTEPLGKFWDGKNGYTYGDGWQAWAKEFPPGTVLRVRVTVEAVRKE